MTWETWKSLKNTQNYTERDRSMMHLWINLLEERKMQEKKNQTRRKEWLTFVLFLSCNHKPGQSFLSAHGNNNACSIHPQSIINGK